MPSLPTTTEALKDAAERLGCRCDDGVTIEHAGQVIGAVPVPWQAHRPEAFGGAKTFHRSAPLAVLALLQTYYTPAKGQ